MHLRSDGVSMGMSSVTSVSSSNEATEVAADSTTRPRCPCTGAVICESSNSIVSDDALCSLSAPTAFSDRCVMGVLLDPPWLTLDGGGGGGGGDGAETVRNTTFINMGGNQRIFKHRRRACVTTGDTEPSS